MQLIIIAADIDHGAVRLVLGPVGSYSPSISQSQIRLT